jgi:capsular polysaccharide export protein
MTRPTRLPVPARPPRALLLAALSRALREQPARARCAWASTAATASSGPTGQSYIAQTDPLDTWPGHRPDHGRHGITDLVVYGDTRPIHATAIAQARRRGITVHVFEEGYLRPYWVTYERGGANGIRRSWIPRWTEMRRALDGADMDLPDAPARWGALAPARVLRRALPRARACREPPLRRRQTASRPHRRQEFRLYLKRLALMPWHWLDRVAATRASCAAATLSPRTPATGT